MLIEPDKFCNFHSTGEKGKNRKKVVHHPHRKQEDLRHINQGRRLVGNMAGLSRFLGLSLSGLSFPISHNNSLRVGIWIHAEMTELILSSVALTALTQATCEVQDCPKQATWVRPPSFGERKCVQLQGHKPCCATYLQGPRVFSGQVYFLL